MIFYGVVGLFYIFIGMCGVWKDNYFRDLSFKDIYCNFKLILSGLVLKNRRIKIYIKFIMDIKIIFYCFKMIFIIYDVFGYFERWWIITKNGLIFSKRKYRIIVRNERYLCEFWEKCGSE